MKNIFQSETAAEVILRIEKLKPEDKPLWGKMSADQMLAHCNVSYAMTWHPEKFKKSGAVKKFFLKLLVKKFVTSESPYRKNGGTAPEFIQTGQYDFEKEKAELIGHVQKVQQLGADWFEGRDNISFGKMTSREWNNLFYKHLDHHLTQFGI